MKSTYSEKLRDPRWQKKRLEILGRDEFCCQLCFDSKSTLHVHHRFYRAGLDPWEYEANALVTLCEYCHEEETATAHFTKELIENIRLCGYSNGDIKTLSNAFQAVASLGPLHLPLRDDIAKSVFNIGAPE